MAILSKVCKPDNFESHNSLKLTFTNIRGLRSNFVDCESFLESNSPDILALCETNRDDSIDSGNFSVRGYLPLIRKDSSTHMHGLAVYVKEGLPFARDLSLENSADSYLCFRLALLHSVSYFFFLYRSPSSSLCTVFDSVSSNIDEVLSVNPSANVFVFGDFNVHHKDWLTYSGGTDRPGELCYNFSISNDLTQIVNFPTRIPDCDSHSPALLDLFLSSDASICSTMAFPPLGNSDHVVVSVSIDFPSLPRNLALGTFGELLIVFSTKVNLLYLLYSTDRRCCLLHLIKQNYLLKTSPRTQILMTLISLYLFFILELI